MTEQKKKRHSHCGVDIMDAKKQDTTGQIAAMYNTGVQTQTSQYLLTPRHKGVTRKQTYQGSVWGQGYTETFHWLILPVELQLQSTWIQWAACNIVSRSCHSIVKINQWCYKKSQSKKMTWGHVHMPYYNTWTSERGPQFRNPLQWATAVRIGSCSGGLRSSFNIHARIYTSNRCFWWMANSGIPTEMYTFNIFFFLLDVVWNNVFSYANPHSFFVVYKCILVKQRPKGHSVHVRNFPGIHSTLTSQKWFVPSLRVCALNAFFASKTRPITRCLRLTLHLH